MSRRPAPIEPNPEFFEKDLSSWNMKKLGILTALVLFSQAAFGQLQLSFISIDQNAVTTVPRYALDFPFIKNLHKGGMHAGLSIRNQGIIYDEASSGDRIKFRAYSLSPEIKTRQKLGSVALEIGAGMDWYFHYKQKRFVGGERSNKTTEFAQWIPNPGVSNVNRVNQFNPYARFAIGKKSGPGLYVEYYFLKDFLNADYSYTDATGMEVKPYSGFSTQRMNIGIWVAL